MMTPKKWMGWGFSLFLGVGILFYFLLSKPSARPVQTVERLQFLRPSITNLVPTLKLKGYGTKGEEGFWREKIHEFELQNKCAVLVQWSSQEEGYYQELRTGQESWDLIMVSDTELEGLHQSNRLTPLSLPSELETKMIPRVLSLFRRGEFYEAIPYQFSTLALYYNKQIFDRRGVAYPDDHWTWEDLLAIARGLYVDSKSGKGCYGIEMDWSWKLLNLFAGQSGEVLLSDTMMMNPHPERATVLGVQWLIDLAQNYAVDIASPEEGELSYFEKGEAAMAITGVSLMNRLKIHHEFIWGVTVLPKGKIKSNHLSAQGWGVWGESKQRELAYSLLLHLTKQSPLFGGLPVYQPDIQQLNLPPESYFYEAIANSNPMTSHPLIYLWKEKVKNHWSAVLNGVGTSASVWMDEINIEIQSSVERVERERGSK